MAIDLNEDDHILLDRYLNTVLGRYARDRDITAARTELAQVVAMVAIDNEDFRHHMAGAITEIGEPS
jgi:hypothetical protein